VGADVGRKLKPRTRNLKSSLKQEKPKTEEQIFGALAQKLGIKSILSMGVLSIEARQFFNTTEEALDFASNEY